MIDFNSLREHIRFIIEHYGTKTQGEDHRFDLVAAYLTELIIRLNDYEAAIKEVSNNYREPLAASFLIKVK